MADKKISALPASTTPLAGTEVLPIVQSGATKQVSVSDLTAGRAISVTSVTASTGNFIVGTSGQGIDFSATPGTGTSELLSDYEEGTWTADLQFGGASTGITYVVRQATYTKIGRTVFIQASMYLSSKGSATGDAKIAGLPFVSATGAFKAEAGIVSLGSGFTAIGTVYGSVDVPTTIVSLAAQSGGNATNLTNVAFANNTYFALSLTYTV